ncbi:general secretion pathway protein GspK [bacterium]|nr:general secretion pathway protein GspK [bacterium]MBU1754261.1 general secretion pathway protein GspK [bacterium]
MKNEEGVVLVITLWVLAILSLLAISFAYQMRIGIRLAGYQVDSLRALYLAKAGVNYALCELKKDTNEYDSLNEAWNLRKRVEFGGGMFICQISDEEQRINLNYATRTILERLPGINEEIASCLLDWQDADSKEQIDGAEDDYYQGIGKSYYCKNAAFESIEELLLVKGINREIFDGISSLTTVYTAGVININTAPERVLMSLPGLNKELAQKIVYFRAGWDGKEGTEDDRIFTAPQKIKQVEGVGEGYQQFNQMVTTKSGNLRISSIGMINRVIKRITVVVENNTGRVKYWQEG